MSHSTGSASCKKSRKFAAFQRKFRSVYSTNSAEMHWEFDAFPAHKTRLNFSERGLLKAQKQGAK
jgi:predicted GNAT superfamily acetyltransferase